MISISIQSRMSYAAFDTTKNYDSFMGMFNDIIVVADPMRSKEGLWIKDHIKYELIVGLTRTTQS